MSIQETLNGLIARSVRLFEKAFEAGDLHVAEKALRYERDGCNFLVRAATLQSRAAGGYVSPEFFGEAPTTRQ